eukprot:gene25664-biopygen4516
MWVGGGGGEGQQPHDSFLVFFFWGSEMPGDSEGWANTPWGTPSSQGETALPSVSLNSIVRPASSPGPRPFLFLPGDRAGARDSGAQLADDRGARGIAAERAACGAGQDARARGGVADCAVRGGEGVCEAAQRAGRRGARCRRTVVRRWWWRVPRISFYPGA